MNKSGIYTIANSVNGKVYVGSAIDFPRRWAVHRSQLRQGSHGSRHLQKAWKKYGESAFVFRRIIYCNKESLLLWEQIAIDGHVSSVGWDSLYNINPTAGSALGSKHFPGARTRLGATWRGRTHSPESKVLMSTVKKGRSYHTPESRARISASLIGNSRSLGHKSSAETRAKISTANKGKPYGGFSFTVGHRPSAETRAKISKANKGRVRSEECKAKMSAVLKGKPLTVEHREKISTGLRAAYYEGRRRKSLKGEQPKLPDKA